MIGVMGRGEGELVCGKGRLVVNTELSRSAGVNLTGKFLGTGGKFTTQMKCSGKCVQHRPALYKLIQVREAIVLTGVE